MPDCESVCVSVCLPVCLSVCPLKPSNRTTLQRFENRTKYSLFIHLGYLYSASSRPISLLLGGPPDTARIPCSEFPAEAPQTTWSEGLAQGPCMAARGRFEPTTLRTKGDESTNEQPRLTILISYANFLGCGN